MIGPQIDGIRLEQAEFDVNGVDCKLARATVRQVLADLNGVRDVQFRDGAAIISYNPVGVTREEICAAIRQVAGSAPVKEPRMMRTRVREKRKTTLGIL